MIDALEADLRSAMHAGSADLELPDGMSRRAWTAGRRPRSGTAKRGLRSRLHRLRREINARYTRPQLGFAGAALVVVVVVIAAFALGGGSTNPLAKTKQTNALLSPTVPVRPGAGTSHQSHSIAGSSPATSSAGGTGGANGGNGRPGVPKAPSPVLAPQSRPLAASNGAATTTSGGGSTDSVTGNGDAAAFGPTTATPSIGNSGVTATRVVKTGSLSLTVKKGLVGQTISALTAKTTELGGYVSQSRTDDVDGAPAGSLTLRIPVNNFEDAVTAAAGLGHETSLSTNAHDVTGKFVDLNARLSALKRTRSTYLTILSRARTIGQTLSVQQRVNNIQQQIESRQGELKVLRNQSADGTLTVDVSEVGAAPAAVIHPHHRSGWSKAWHNSTSRFNRGIQAIIGGLGPLLLALILLALLYAIGRLILRRPSGRSNTSE